MLLLLLVLELLTSWYEFHQWLMIIKNKDYIRIICIINTIITTTTTTTTATTSNTMLLLLMLLLNLQLKLLKTYMLTMIIIRRMIMNEKIL